MPQDGSNNYQYPPGTPGIPDTTIESEAYNTFLDDLVINDLNIPRPVHRGGTGASTADAALVNLKAEKAEQVVTAYLSHVWMPGSFRSAVGATDAPVAGHAFAGICYINEPLVLPPTNANVTVEARDMTDGKLYVRQKTAGTWGAWTQQAGGTTDLDAAYVNVAGDTMTGALILSAQLTMDAGFKSFDSVSNIKLRWGGSLAIERNVDGSGWFPMFDTSNSPNAANYVKFANGIIFQHGVYSSASDGAVTFPTAFPTACISVQITANSTGLPADGAVIGHADGPGPAGFVLRKRFANNGGAVGIASQPAFWAAVGY